MDIKRYIAMTGAEFSNAALLQEHPAWMACHFSPYSTGLSNLPDTLPEESMIILNDSTPLCGHDPEFIATELNYLADKCKANAFLLDFQRERTSETEDFVEQITNKLNRQVAVTEQYGTITECAVFLSCPRPCQSVAEKAALWKNRDLWLELATESETITIKKDNAIRSISSPTALSGQDFKNSSLNCRYRTEIFDKKVTITLERSVENIPGLLEEANVCGIKITVGLYQQLYPK